MAADLLGGAAIGAVFAELLKAVLEATDLVLKFKPILKRIETTLRSIIPIFEDIEGLDRNLDRRKEETQPILEVIKNGKNLVLECSRIRGYNLFKRQKCAKELLKLEEKLNMFIQIVLPVQNARDLRQLLMETRGSRLSLTGKKGDGFSALCAVPEAPVNHVGLEVAIQELKMELFKVEVSMVVLSAPPGCGKTTLAKLLCHDSQVKEKFGDNIFYVIVSKNTTLEDIVRILLDNNEIEFRNEDDVVRRLEQFLKRKESPILLVLDDVWAESESFLDKFRFHFTDYKVLVTSRSLFPGFGSLYKLQPLNPEDSLTLLRHAAGLQDTASDIPEETVNQVVKECKGFPLALKVVGGSLRGMPEEIWKSTVTDLSENGSILEYSDLLKSLQRSLETLEDKVIVKECFMDLCLFPEDERIPIATLIDMWMELYNINADKAVAYLLDLSYRNLLDLVIRRKDVCGCYNQQFVTCHDLLRELAIRHQQKETKRLIMEIRANKVPEWWMEQKQIRARLLSISTDENFSSGWCNIQAPEVEALVLNFKAKSYYLPEFMEKMKELKVLIILNNGFSPCQLCNFPLLGSLCNLKRIRLEHISIPAFGFASIKLENLQKMTLVMCTNISQAFSTSNTQILDTLPNLVEVSIDYCKDMVKFPDEICNLIKVKMLGITNCPELAALPDEICRLVNLEVLRLNSCINLSALPTTIGSLQKLTILDISECYGIETLPEEVGSLQKLRVLDISECSEIQRLPEKIGDLQNLNKLHMVGCSDSFALPPSVSRLENLMEVVCDEGTESVWKLQKAHLKDLKIKVQKKEDSLKWL